jgi:hypothetical protein
MATGPNYRPNIQLPNLMGGTGNPYDLNLYPQDMIWEKPEGWNESSLSGMTGKTAFLPSDKRHGILQTLDSQVQNDLFMNDQNRLQYQDLLRQDTEGFNKGKWDRTLPADRYVNAGNVMNDASNFGLFSHANAAESDGQYLMDKENFDYNALYGDNYSDLKIPGINAPRIPYKSLAPDSSQRYRDYNQKRFAWATYPDTDLSPQELAQERDQLETIDPYGNDPYGTEHHYVTPDKKRSLPTFGLSRILKGLKNQFKINPEKQKEFDSWEENKNQKGWGYIGDTGLRGNIYEGSGGKKFSLVDPTTGYNVLQNKNWRGGTGNSLREQINLKNAWIADRLLRGKGLSGKARAYAKLNKLGTYADKETFTPPPGGGPLNEPGGEWVGGAPAYTHQGIGGGEYTNEIGNVEYQDPYDPGGGEAAGGLMRIHSRGRYSKGGRVGILAAF